MNRRTRWFTWGVDNVRTPPISKAQWIQIYGGCEDCENNCCTKMHTFTMEDIERVTGMSRLQIYSFAGTHDLI